MKKIFSVAALCISFFIVKAQDNILLKSGKSITGRIFSFENDIVKIKTTKDTVVYKLDEIKSLRYNGPSTKTDISSPVQLPAENKNRKKETEAKPIKIEQ